MNGPLEKEIQKQLLQYLHLQHIPCWRQNAGAIAGEYKGKRRFVRFASMPGISDILGVLSPGGRLLAVEVKRKGGKPSPDQIAFLELVRLSGGVAGVCCSVADLELLLSEAGVSLC